MNQAEGVDALDGRPDGPSGVAHSTTARATLRYQERSDPLSGCQSGVSNGIDQFLRHLERRVQVAIEVSIEGLCKLLELLSNSELSVHQRIALTFLSIARLLEIGASVV